MSADYVEVNFVFSPVDDDEMDVLAALLAEYGYESFETVKNGMNAYVNKDDYDEKNVESALQSYRFRSKVKWTTKLIKGDDWNEEWERNSFKPMVIGGDCVIHASYHDDFPHCRYEIVIDPKMSFGSGHHETTSMLVEELLKSDLRGKTVLDMGAGTGILSILSAKLGASKVIGVEIDEGAYINACDNCRLNAVDVDMKNGDADTLQTIGVKCDVLLANINRNIILNDIDKYVSVMSPNAELLISGFYRSDVGMLVEVLSKRNLLLKETTERNDWVMAKFVMKNA